MSDPNEPTLFECEQQEREDAISEMKQLGADEKSMVDQADSLCEEGIIYGAIVQLARSDRFRGYLMTDTGAAAELVESAILKRAQAFDVVVVK